ncbi:FMN-binding negative transcriptional regulator [Lacibacter sp. H407]|uniref:FMN-binding negative transcriptional regulator n=1 Tax=Lacibacter sp. H407 TaxID=3133423 RepID=UPI0030BDC513
MYNLTHFKEPDQSVVTDFMKQHPFAMLIGNADGRSVATQIPLLFEERNGKMILLGHMMKKQDHQLAFEKNPEVLVVFTGPHTYVSATWYEDPHQASTWNYVSVHARGSISFLDEQGLKEALQKLSSHYEQHDPHATTVFNNLSHEYTSPLLKAIVAFEIEVNSVEHVFKLSQNRDEKSYHHIIDHLKAEGGEAAEVAKMMEERKEKVYPSA